MYRFCSSLLILLVLGMTSVGSSIPVSADLTIVNSNIMEPTINSMSDITFEKSSYWTKSNPISANKLGNMPHIYPKDLNNILNLFNQYTQKIFLDSEIPGAAVVIISQGQVKYLKCFGVRNVKTLEPVNYNTLFEIGSSTKAFTSANLAQLVDAGIISWNDKVKFYPDAHEFRMHTSAFTNEVRIRDLLSHQTGLSDHGADALWMSFLDNYPNILYKMRFVTPTAKLRAVWQYNNIMYNLAGQCAARVSCTSWSRLITENLLKTLKMYRTTTNYGDFQKNTNRIQPYKNYWGKYYEYDLNLDAVDGAGSIASSIKDMANWMNFQLANGKFEGKQIVSEKSLLQTRYPLIKSTMGEMYYGMGWFISPQGLVDHAGTTGASVSVVAFKPSQHWGMVVLSNEGHYGQIFGNSLLSAWGQLYNTGKISRDLWPLNKKYVQQYVKSIYNLKHQKPNPPLTPALNYNTYTGVYNSPTYGQIRVVKKDGNLKLFQGNNKQPLNLEHWKGNIFRVNHPLSAIEVYTKVQFRSIKNGKSQIVTFDYYWQAKTNGNFLRTNPKNKHYRTK